MGARGAGLLPRAVHYFADQKLKEGHLRDKYDVIIFPHVGGTSQSMITGTPMTGSQPIPYKKIAI